MSAYYQNEVLGAIDYALHDTPYGFKVRGPYSSRQEWIRESISFIGAAQTFGHFVKTPFPRLVSEVFSVNALNAGVSGAGPELFLSNDRLIEDINRSKLCVIQVMSGRSSSNRYFTISGGSSMGRLQVNDITRERIQGHDAFGVLLKELSEAELRDVVDETLENYAASYRDLCRRITVKKILLWVAVREPRYERDYRYASSLLGDFPHLVDDKTLDVLSSYCDDTVLVHSRFGLGRRLWNHNEGEPYVVNRPWGSIDTHTHMYSDPYIHLTAAKSLVDRIGQLGLV